MTTRPAGATMNALFVPKGGSSDDEWEDGFAFSEASGRAAVADGASTSAHARLWAAQLTRRMIEHPVDLNDTAGLRQWFTEALDGFVDQKGDADASAAWYASEVAARDAFATLLVLQIGDTSATAASIGDCNLFVLDANSALLAAWPQSRADQFGSAPDLVSTNAGRLDATLASLKRCRIGLEPATTIVLATDALAEWALSVHESEPDVWQLLHRIDPADFRRLIDDLRMANEIVNDDVTVLRIDLPSAVATPNLRG